MSRRNGLTSRAGQKFCRKESFRQKRHSEQSCLGQVSHSYAKGVLDICLGVESDEKYFHDFNLSSIEVIRNYGYPAEIHKVQTEDGYILELHRIPHGKFSDSKRRVPILMGHGLLASSIEFFLLESDSLAFVLADAGYDVWMLNFRGSTYSRNHTSLQSDDRKFWNFSWHEKGLYDIPSSIDYVCKYTQRNQLLYIGYSMGTTAFFVMASTRPEYQQKLQGAVLLGPTAYVKHTKTPLRILAPFSKTIKGLYEFIGKGVVFEQTPELQSVMKVLCKPQFFCKNFLFLMAGRNSQGFQNKVLPKAVMHLPASTSVKTAAHYGQLIMSGKFQQYDYGTARNLKRYHQAKPPIYNLEAITIPLSIFVAPNDFFTTKKDLERLFQRLHSVKNVHIIPSPKFTHIDFVVSKNIRELLYPELLKEVEHLTRRGTVAKPVKERAKAHQNKAVPNMNHNQDKNNGIRNTRIDHGEISYNPAEESRVNYNEVDQNKVVYNEPQYNSADHLKYVYSMDNIDYNPGDYNPVNQNEIVYNEADYNLIDQNKDIYYEANQDKVVYNDDQYNQAVENEVAYNEDQYSQAIDQNKVVYNADYNAVAYNSDYQNDVDDEVEQNDVDDEVEQNEVVYNEDDQNEDFYKELDYVPVNYKKVLPLNYKNVDYSGAQYSDF